MANKLYKPLLIDSVKAAVDLQEHRFVGFDGHYCSAGAKALGVIDVSTSKDQFAPVALFGILLVQAGGTVTAGEAVASDAEGRAVKAENSDLINGYAMDDGVSGQDIRIIRGI